MATTPPVSPRNPVPSTPQKALPPQALKEESSPVEKTKEKVNSIFFDRRMIALGSYLGLMLWYGGRFFKERKVSLILPAIGWSLGIYAIGWIERILRPPVKEEGVKVPSAPIQIYKPGQPIPIVNSGNNCYAISLIQALMNDPELARTYEEICQKEVARHAAFLSFLEKPLPPSKNLFSTLAGKIGAMAQPITGTSPPFKNEEISDIIVMVSRRMNEIGSKIPVEKYPFLLPVLQEFSAAQTDEVFKKVIPENVKNELEQLRTDPALLSFFSSEKQPVSNKLKGFKAFVQITAAYQRARTQTHHVVSLARWISSSPLDDLRYLFFNAGENLQEDAEELFRCLIQYVLPQDVRRINFSVRQIKHYTLCSEEEIDPELSMDGEFTPMPVDGQIIETARDSILRIDSMVDGDKGEVLCKLMFEKHETESDPVVFLVGGESQQFKMRQEQYQFEPIPHRFIIQLKRFERVEAGVVKNNCKVDMPETIEIQGAHFHLQSVIVHDGDNLENGHYYAVVKDKDDKWWVANDDKTYRSDPEIALTKGTLYFYRIKENGAVAG